MRITDLIVYIWVVRGYIGNHNNGFLNGIYDVMNNRILRKNIIGSDRIEPEFLTDEPDDFIV